MYASIRPASAGSSPPAASCTHTGSVVTLETSHKLMSSLNVAQFWKRDCSDVIADTSHNPIAPYVACAVTGSLHHALAAVASWLFEVKTVVALARAGSSTSSSALTARCRRTNLIEMPAPLPSAELG